MCADGRSDFFLGPQSFVEGAALVPGTRCIKDGPLPKF